MIPHFTMRTYGVNQKFRFVEGIWSHRKGHQIRTFSGKKTCLHHTCATCAELPSYKSTMMFTRAQVLLQRGGGGQEER